MKTAFRFLSAVTVLLLTLIVCYGITACSSNDNGVKKSAALSERQNSFHFDENTVASDVNILAVTESININQIALGRLGTGYSSSPEIQQFSKMLTEEHTVASTELKNIAEQKNMDLPGAAVSSEYDDISKLESEKITAFDKEFITIVIQYHKDAIDKFEIADLATADNEIKIYLATVLPTLKKHLMQAEQIQTGKMAQLY